MLASDNRLTSSADFKKTTQLGARVSTKTLAGYALIEPTLTAPKIGFIVSRALGGSVARHRVTRQLRHLSRENIKLLPNNSFVVVRALHNSQDYSSDTKTLFEKLSHRLADQKTSQSKLSEVGAR